MTIEVSFGGMMIEETAGSLPNSPGTAVRLANVDLVFDARLIVRIVAVCAAIVWSLGLFRQVVVAILNVDTDVFGWNLINLDAERSIPTLFSVMLLFSGAAAAAITSIVSRKTEPQRVVGWALLSAMFLLMCADESLSFHEVVGETLGQFGHWGGLFYFPWVAPGLAVVLVVGLAFVPFLRGLRRTTAVRLAVAGGVFVSGALGMEMLGGAVADGRGRGDYFAICFLLEEGGEMAGVVLFLRALLLHIAEGTERLSIAVRR